MSRKDHLCCHLLYVLIYERYSKFVLCWIFTTFTRVSRWVLSLLMCSPRPRLSLLSVIYLTQRKWQVLMWYKDKCSGLMELKSTLLFPCCARWHMWDSCLSLKKINAWGIFPSKESSLRACMPSSAWEVISLDFSFLISPSLHKL